MSEAVIKDKAPSPYKSDKKPLLDISSLALHLLAMAFMLCDHMWATVIAGQQWLTMIGRLAFPIFAFLIAEGYFHTSNFKKYAIRMLIFALISEIPFNLMMGSSVIYPFQQNVLWTFLFALLCMKSVDKIRDRHKPFAACVLAFLTVIGFMLAALLTMTDYNAYGVLTVMVFYFFRGKRWYHRLGQLAGLVWINCFMIKGLVIPLELFGHSFELSRQSISVLAFAFILCYHGRQGCHNRFTQLFCYAFYPLHMLVLALIIILR